MGIEIESGSKDRVKDKVIMRLGGWVFKETVFINFLKRDYDKYVDESTMDIKYLRYLKRMK